MTAGSYTASVPPPSSPHDGRYERPSVQGMHIDRRGSMRGLKTSSFCLLFAALFFVAASLSPVAGQAPRPSGVTLFEGARLIVGDGSAPIEDSAFIVEGDRFTQIGRKGQLAVPAGAARIDLTGR